MLCIIILSIYKKISRYYLNGKGETFIYNYDGKVIIMRQQIKPKLRRDIVDRYCFDLSTGLLPYQLNNEDYSKRSYFTQTSIRNHSQQDYVIESHLGFRHNARARNKHDVPSNEKTKSGLMLDVAIAMEDVEDFILNFKHASASSNLCQLIQDKLIYAHEDACEKLRNSRMRSEAWSLPTQAYINFTVHLDKSLANVNGDSFLIESLGLFISPPGIERKDFVTAYFGFDRKSEFGANDFSIELVDNTDTLNNVWMLIAGNPAKIRAIKDHNVPSGLYIITSKGNEGEEEEIFFPIHEIADKAAEYGVALSRQELMNGIQNKAYQTLLKERDALAQSNKEKADKIHELNARIAKLDEKNDTTTEKLKSEIEKLVNDIKQLNINHRQKLEQLEYGHKLIVDNLNSEIERLKREIKYEQRVHTETVDKLKETYEHEKRVHKTTTDKIKEIHEHEKRMLKENIEKLKSDHARDQRDHRDSTENLKRDHLYEKRKLEDNHKRETDALKKKLDDANDENKELKSSKPLEGLHALLNLGLTALKFFTGVQNFKLA